MNDIDKMPDLPESSASIQGGTNGAVSGVDRAALKRGFSNETLEPRMEDINGDTSAKDANEFAPRGGFVGRPRGWDR